MLIELIAFVLLCLFIWTNWQMFGRRWSLPPGPFPWPLIGNLFQLDPAKPHVTIQNWSKIYGPVFTMWMGLQPTIIIADYEMMKEAMMKHGDQLASRPKFFVFEYFTKGPFGIALTSGEAWKEQRRFSLHVLRNFGLGRNLMEGKVLIEAKRLVESIRDDMGSSNEIVMDMTNPIQLCVASIISSTIFGQKFEKGDQRFKLLKDNFDEYFQIYGSFRIFLVNSCPWLRHVPLFGHFGMDEMRRVDRVFKTFLTTELEKHKKELETDENDDEEPKDFSAAYLKEIKRRQRDGEDLSYFSDWQLLITIEDLWIGGMDTTVTSLRWAILAMIKYPRVQEKVRQEIDAVLGREKLPSLSDRPSTPYVMATLNEVHRWGNVIPINLYHTNDVELKLGGYKIPKNTHVIPQISCLAYDEKFFPEPDQFRPERFLEADGKTLRKVEQYAPFSMGKRQCVGEGLARTEIFLVFVYLLQRFRFSVVPGQQEPTAEPTMHVTLAPRDFECLVTSR